MRLLLLFSLSVLSSLNACAGSTPEVQSAAKPAAMALPTHDTMTTIANDYWAFQMKRQPRWATMLGDRRYDAFLEDISADARAAERKSLRGFLDRAAALEGLQLTEDDRLNREVLVHSIEAELGQQVCHFAEWRLDHLDGLQSNLAELPSYHTTLTQAQALALLARYQAVPKLFATHIENLNQGLKQGWVASQINVERLLSQLDGMLGAPAESSPFLPKREGFAADLSVSNQDALLAEINQAIIEQVLPSYRAYREFVATKIKPKARAVPGIAALSFGPECYASQIFYHTGLRLSPKAIHEIGVAEVNRIHQEMQAIIKKLGKGKVKSIRDFVKQLEKDPRQHAASREKLLEQAQTIMARAQAALPRAFGRLPKVPIYVKPLEAFREKESPAAYYYQAPDDGSRPAYYYLNTYKAYDRYLFDAEALAHHEAVPGHHLQIALAQELTNVPTFRRQEGQTAFVEGWALYAEWLAKELSLYTSIESEFGREAAEVWRALRLVIDTGLHAFSWSREQAIKTFLDGAASPELEVINEVDRYITWPGQALAYKIGELEIRRLRKYAEDKLGSRFSLSAFHDQLLQRGAIPISVLSRIMTRWVDEQVAMPLATPATQPSSGAKEGH